MIQSLATCMLLVVAVFCQRDVASAQDSQSSGKKAPLSDVQQPQDTPKEFGAYFEELRQPYIESARKSYPEAKARFNAGLPKGYSFFVTIDFHDKKLHENAFMRVRKIADGMITAVVATELTHIKSHSYGDELTFPESEVLDWTIVSPDGKEEGNLIGKFLDNFYRTH